MLSATATITSEGVPTMQKRPLASFAAHASSRRRFAGRTVLLPSLSVALLLVLVGLSPCRGTDFAWLAAADGNWVTDGNWDNTGHPQTTADTATFAVAGSPYAVTLAANKTIGGLTVSSTDASLTVGAGSTLRIDNGPLAHVAGTLAGTYRLHGTGTYSGNIDSGQTVSLQTSYSSGFATVTAANGFTINGTLSLNATGVSWWPENVTFNVSSGTLTNAGTMTLATGGSWGATVNLSADLTNSSTGSITMNRADGGGNFNLTKAAATYSNSGSWTQSSASLIVVGNGSSFSQTAAGASFAVNSMTFGSNDDATQNSFTATAGSVSGSYTFWRTAVSLGASATVPSATTFRFRGDNIAGSDAGKPINTWTGNVPANLTLHIAEGGGGSTGGFLDATGSFANAGTITVTKNGGYDPNGAYGRLRVLANGTLTNSGTFNLEVGAPYTTNGSSAIIYEGHLLNQAGGLVAVSTIANANGTGTKTVRFTKTGDASYVNRGLVTLSQATTNPFLRWELTNGTLVNENGGIIRGLGTTVVSTSTILGGATLYNATGVIEAVGSSETYALTVSNALSAGTRSGAALLAGSYRVIGGDAATTLSLSAFGGAGTIATLGGGASPATVTLDGATATFTQLESAAGSLAAIAANGTLNLLGGKSFVAAPTLANAGTILVGAGSSLGLGGAGTGTLNSTGTLTVHGTLGGAGAAINVNAGILDGSGNVIGEVTVAGSGMLTGQVTITGNTVIQNLHSPGDSPAIQMIDGDYTLDGGILLIELGGATPGSEHDQLVVTGDAILDGILAVEFLPGYFPEPKKGVTYDVLTAASIEIASGFSLGGTWGGMFLWEVLDEQAGSVLRLTSNIPEPASALLLLGLAAAGLHRRRDAGVRDAR